MQGIGAKTDGEEVVGIFAAASASTFTPVSLFDKAGNARTLLANETIKVLNVNGSVHSNNTLSLLTSAGDTKPILKQECLGASPFHANFGPGRFCSVGRTPGVIAGTSQTYLQFNGEILKTQGAENA